MSSINTISSINKYIINLSTPCSCVHLTLVFTSEIRYLRSIRLASRLRSVFFLIRLKIVDGVLMGSDKSVSHKIFVSFFI